MNILKSIGGVLIGITLFVGGIVAVVLFFVFGSKIAFAIAPFINWLTGILLFVDVVLLLFAIIPKARPVIGLIIFVSSYVFGLSTWIYGLAVTLALWGWLAVIIGVLLGGVGVVPIGLLAAIFHGEWGLFWTLLLSLLLTYGSRIIGQVLAESEPQQQTPHHTIIDIEPEETRRSWKDID